MTVRPAVGDQRALNAGDKWPCLDKLLLRDRKKDRAPENF